MPEKKSPIKLLELKCHGFISWETPCVDLILLGSTSWEPNTRKRLCLNCILVFWLQTYNQKGRKSTLKASYWSIRLFKITDRNGVAIQRLLSYCDNRGQINRKTFFLKGRYVLSKQIAKKSSPLGLCIHQGNKSQWFQSVVQSFKSGTTYQYNC